MTAFPELTKEGVIQVHLTNIWYQACRKGAWDLADKIFEIYRKRLNCGSNEEIK